MIIVIIARTIYRLRPRPPCDHEMGCCSSTEKCGVIKITEPTPGGCVKNAVVNNTNKGTVAGL